MGWPDSDDLQHVANAPGRGDITTRISHTVLLAHATPAPSVLRTPHHKRGQTRHHHRLTCGSQRYLGGVLPALGDEAHGRRPVAGIERSTGLATGAWPVPLLGV